MATDLSLMLNHDMHLKTLLKYYLGTVEPTIKENLILEQDDWEYVHNPDNTVSTFRDGVVTGGRSGAINIRDGYLRALAHALKKEESPSHIRVISIINHLEVHWTTSVTEIELEPEFINTLNQIFIADKIQNLSINDIINKINDSLHPESSRDLIENSMEIFGAKSISIEHYDSHNANPTTPDTIGHYYSNYELSLEEFLEVNKTIARITPKKCKQQKGNTCGDNSLWNGFVAGVLGLPVGNDEFQMDSEHLRAFSEYMLEDLNYNPEDEEDANDVADSIALNIAKAISLATLNPSSLSSKKDEPSKKVDFTAPIIEPPSQKQKQEQEQHTQKPSQKEKKAPAHTDVDEAVTEGSHTKKEVRKKLPPVVFSQTLSHDEPETNQSIVVQKSPLTLKELETRLNDTTLQEQLCIKSIRPKEVGHSLEVEFEIKLDKSGQKNQTFTGYIEELPKTSDENAPLIEYSIDKNMEQSLEKAAMKRMCEMAVATAKPNTEFNLEGTDEKQKKAIFNMLTDAIAQSLEDHTFDEKTAPKILGYDDLNKRKTLGHN